MYRDSAEYRDLIEVSFSGLGKEEEVAEAILASFRADLAGEGVILRSVQRGAVPDQVILTVGPGAELAATRLIDQLAGRLGAKLQGIEVYLHPFSVPRPMFFQLPGEALEAKRCLLEAAKQAPARFAPIPAPAPRALPLRS
jgi:hypothetical protein